MLADRLLATIAKHTFCCKVPTGDNSVESLTDNGIVGGFNNRCQPELIYFCLPALGQISKHTEGTRNPSFSIANRTGVGQHIQRTPIFASEAKIKLLKSALQIVPDTLLGFGHVFRKDKLRDRTAYHFLCGIAKHICHALVDIECLRLCIGEPDAFVGCLDDGTVLLLIFSFSLFALGDISIDLQDGGRLVTAITGEDLAAFYNDLSAVFASMDQFSFPLLACYEKGIDCLAVHRKACLKQ